MADEKHSFKESLRRTQEYTGPRSRDVYDAFVKYTVAINGGGLIVTLAFMGAVAEKVSPGAFIPSVGSFASGILVAGLAIMMNWHYHARHVRKVESLIDEIERGRDEKEAEDKDWRPFLKRERRLKRWIVHLPGYLAFIAIAVGAILAVSALGGLSARQADEPTKMSVEINEPISVEAVDPVSVEIGDPISVEIEGPVPVEVVEPED